MPHLLLPLLGALRSAFRNRGELVVENLALQQQFAAFASSGRRPHVAAADRGFWIALCRLWSRWSDVLVFVKPETVIRWHRAGFRRDWTWLSPVSLDHARHSPRPGRARASETRRTRTDRGTGMCHVHGLRRSVPRSDRVLARDR